MTQTVQYRSCGYINKTEKKLSIDKPEDNMRLLLSIFDSLNNLCEKLNRLDYVIKRKKIELSIYMEFKGEIK